MGNAMKATAGARMMGLDDFINHSTREFSGGGRFLNRWKQGKPPQVDVWLHTTSSMAALWQHQWPRIVAKEDQDTRVTRNEVWGGTFNCWENEDTLKRQYFRDRETGVRRHPPQICPMCKFIEEVRRLVDGGKLDWVTPLFEFVGDDSAKGRVLHAAGLYNGYKDADPAQIKELNKIGIYMSEAWKENSMPRCQYVMRVVDNDHPKEGVQIAIETTLLGDCMKAEIGRAMKSLGTEEGHPLKNPYCLRWEYFPTEKLPQNRYSVTRMARIKLTSEIEELIREKDPPSIESLCKRGNAATLRAEMEHYYVGPKGMFDWDVIFESVEKQDGQTEDASDPTPGDSIDRRTDESSESELVVCDNCGEAMLETDDVCPNCGMSYSDEPSEPEPPPPPVRRRSSVKTQSASQTSSVGSDDDDVLF